MSDYDKNISREKKKYDAWEAIPVMDPKDRASFPPLDSLVTNVVSHADREPTKGLKYDQNKEPLDLLSRIWIFGVARVMGHGAKKYAAHNWRNGLARSRLAAAALRHIFQYMDGEDVDSETGESHLDHASCCLMFMRESHETHPELDDRYKRRIK